MHYKCLTHSVELIDEGNTRQFVTPPGSWRGMPQCQLLLAEKTVKTGEIGKCQIERVD
ncbi:hypothetical protein ES703_13581 [subsurface metagenome]